MALHVQRRRRLAAAAGSRRPFRGERDDLAFVHAARAAQVVADHRQFAVLALLEQRARRELHFALDASPDLAGRASRHDEDAAAVGRVGDPIRIPAALEPVQYGRDRAGREAALVGEFAGRDAATAIEDAEAAEVGAVEAELAGDRLIQLVAGAAELCELDAHLVDERVARVFIVLHLASRRSTGNSVSRSVDRIGDFVHVEYGTMQI